MEKVLIILATYNGERFLPDQLESLINQKRVDVSVLIRDDNSSDNTQQILEQYRERLDLHWYKGEHIDVEKSYEELLRKSASTDYQFFAFCDQDDVWDEDKLFIGVESIKDFNGPALYYCGQTIVDEELRLISHHELNGNRNMISRFLLSDFAGCTGIFNRALLDRVIAFEPNYMIMHDTWILKVCMCLGGLVVIDPKSHIKYRQHKNNKVGLKQDFISNIIKAKKYINEYQIEKQMRELERGYGMNMVSPYREVCKWILGYKSNMQFRIKLLDKRNIDFHNIGLNITYMIKVMLNRL